MIQRSTTRHLFAAALAMAAISVPAYAQTTPSPLVQQMATEAGTVTLEYWTPKLNDYKTRIDRVLSADDLAALNRLRVRWAVMTADGLRSIKEARVSHGVRDGKEGAEMKMDDKAMARFGETMEIFSQAKEIASRYRSELDGLGKNVVGDFAEFAGQLSDRADRFAAENADAMRKDPQVKDMLAGREKLRGMMKELNSEKKQTEILSVYTFALEPVVLLYNGADLRTLFESAGPIAKPISGLTLPESSTLKQNFPNPASTTTRIVYNLAEPSTATVVRIYDSRGEIMATYDQGAQGEGEHTLDADVSKLASGSYLYHLTVRTANGERVYSRTMQVVR
ncbi:MAG: Por secretion system C-terminal sorting protein [Chlorobi bacterium]|nr:Por secretion system C-terminal sorting protein [Chlorobiota bacterium]